MNSYRRLTVTLEEDGTLTFSTDTGDMLQGITSLDILATVQGYRLNIARVPTATEALRREADVNPLVGGNNVQTAVDSISPGQYL